MITAGVGGVRSWADAGLLAELRARVHLDQQARLRSPDVDWREVQEVDAANLAWFRGVLAELGWPDRSAAGEDGALQAWLLAQHADSDPAFQRHCHRLLGDAVARGEGSRSELAYLTDRVLLAQKLPQLHGTQLTARGGRWTPRRLADPDGVDARRAAVGLPPLADYLATFAADPPPPNRVTIPCACGAESVVEGPEPGKPFELTCAACVRTTTLILTEVDGR